jgi:hypothetical protein
MNIKSLSDDLLKLIASFLVKPKYKLLDWINADMLDYYFLSSNPNAIQFFEQNINKIDWDILSSNPNAIHILKRNLDKVNWCFMSINKNPDTIRLIEQNMH